MSQHHLLSDHSVCAEWHRAPRRPVVRRVEIDATAAIDRHGAVVEDTAVTPSLSITRLVMGVNRYSALFSARHLLTTVSRWSMSKGLSTTLTFMVSRCVCSSS